MENLEISDLRNLEYIPQDWIVVNWCVESHAEKPEGYHLVQCLWRRLHAVPTRGKRETAQVDIKALCWKAPNLSHMKVNKAIP